MPLDILPFCRTCLTTYTPRSVPHSRTPNSNEMTDSDDFKLPFPSMYTESIILNDDYKGCRDPPIYTQAQLLEETNIHASANGRSRADDSDLVEGWGNMFQKQRDLQRCPDCSLRSAMDNVTCPSCGMPFETAA